MITDEVGAVEGWVGIGIVIGLQVLAFTATKEFVSAGSAASLWLAGVIYPFVRVGLTNRANLQIDVDIMEAAYRQLDEKQTNVGAKVQLAKVLHRRGQYISALTLLTDAVEASGDGLEDEKRVLRNWESQHGKASRSRRVRCPRCNAMTPGSERYCRNCAGPVLIYLAGGLNILSTAPLKMFYIWAAAVCMVIVAPGLAMTLPLPVAIGSIVGIVLIALYLMYRSGRSANHSE